MSADYPVFGQRDMDRIALALPDSMKAAPCQLISTAEEQSSGQIQGVVSELSDWMSFRASQASALVERVESLIDSVAASSPEGAS